MNNRHMHNLVRPKLQYQTVPYNPMHPAATISYPQAVSYANYHPNIMMTINPINIANPLNSSLVLRKGKERENPKKKKPSTLKKVRNNIFNYN
jgi:hypothetical protein